LTIEDKAKIEADLPFPGNNVQKLLTLLKTVYPGEATKISQISSDNITRALLWIRNKEEHLAISAWPIPSYVHIEKEKMPSEANSPIGLLNTELAVSTNNYIIDILKYLYDLDTQKKDYWQYERLESYRIHFTI